ncbi:MAG: hypothetical protein QXN68_04815 [Thermoplasmata archaeon]
MKNYQNYLIGIGGTGARVIEAAIFLNFAGFGPEEMSIIIIDPDESNGNLTRTKSLIELYKTCKQNFSDLSDDNYILKTKLNTAGENFVWSIFEEHNVRLADYLSYSSLQVSNKTLADFISVLFTDDELYTPLNEGFRGHPSIGAVVMSKIPEDKDPWKTFWDQLGDYAKTPYSARVFVVGSLFGGTGASGIPTIASLLKQNARALIDGKSKILLGGAFVLPYFTFDVSDEVLNEQKFKMFVTTENFMIATKAALQYYDTKELAYDQIYLIGNYTPRKVGKFSPGSRTQENLPNYIEMITALACFDFFAQPDVEASQSETKFLYALRSEKMSWEDIPVTRDRSLKSLKIEEFKHKLTVTTLFSYLLSTFGEKILNLKHEDIIYTWYKDNFKSSKEAPQYVHNLHKIKNLINLSNQYLWWLSAISNEEFDLIDISRLLENKPEVYSSKDLKFKDPEESQNGSNISLILKNPSDRRKEKDFNDFIKVMNKTKLKVKNLSPATKFVEIFFRAVENFAEDVYNIKPIRK